MIAAQLNDAVSLTLDENVPSGLDWQAFSAAYFPGTRRHNLRAIVAYGAYRRSPTAGAQQTSESARFRPVAVSSEAVSVETWEDEGGASLQVRPRGTQHGA
jgi:hypothetical protein